MADEMWSDDEWRAAMSSAAINDLPDSDFAFIEPGGEKDDEGKTTPRSKRHFPVQDAAHVRNALARAPQSPFGDKAMPKILAAAKKFGVEASRATDDDLEDRADTKACPTCDGSGKIMDGNRECPDCDGTGKVARAADGAPESRETDSSLEARQRRAEILKGTLEHRSFEVEGLEVRSLDDGTIRMSGYASVTETPYRVGKFTETIKRGAFKRTLSESPHVVLLFGHDGMPYASTKNGTLALTEDARGLHWTADLDGQDTDSTVLARKVSQGLIDECSFAFQATDQDWNSDYSDRAIKALSIHRGDVSLVVAGANPETSVSMRSADGTVYELRSGKALSEANRATIQNALDLVAEADKAVDKAQPLLAGVLGVANPDEPTPDAGARSTDTTETAVRYTPDMAVRHRLKLMSRTGDRR